MEYPKDFMAAFNHAMLYEVGGFWNPTDPDTISGATATQVQRKKVGYVNIPADRGGETKYGVAQNANPQLRVYTLNLAGAMACYYQSYWLKGSCDKLPHPIALIHFDGCVNHGIGRANKFLQQAVGAAADGQIGSDTLTALSNSNPSEVIQRISQLRGGFYNAIVQNNPSQKMFLAGWMRRINEVTQFTLAALQ